jgi:hypothetical protein
MRTPMFKRCFWVISLLMLAGLLTARVASAVWPNDPNVNVPISTVSSTDMQVTLNWVTTSEVNNLGFNVLRAVEENGPYVLITPKIISGAGNKIAQSTYSFTDVTAVPGVQYWYKIESLAFNGKTKSYDSISAILSGTKATPIRFALMQNNPNPFNPTTTIHYSIPAGTTGNLILNIYDMRGALVRTLAGGSAHSGLYSVVWDGKDMAGKSVSSGMYVYHLKAGAFTESRKMLLMR